ncbi:hypothetical protein GQ53DRAFT_741482 [Thozetella sp. PMI_491]|nr:hypothetical protein GQ53DRAFT_741482 [Thozetella sp. PMI_491]
MNCSICRRQHSAQKLPFLCAVDARNVLYDGRVETARALLETEELERQVNEALSLSDPAGATSKPPSAARARLERLRSEEAAARDRTQQIMAQADKLRAEVEAARKEIREKKESIEKRKEELATVSDGITGRRSRQLDDTQRAIQVTKYKWARSADTMAATRAFLCEEAARLYGLRQIKKGNARRYELGGIEIADLHTMSNMPPDLISTSLSHIAHILVLASHYLALRLPAEITLPHRDYPRPTIFTLSASYKYGEIPFPGSALSSHPPPDAKGAEQTVPRARLLFLEKPLATLAKEDPATYALFLEGVTLLAYDIAWACCSQGVSIGDRNSYEDVCNMGQNLYRLLIGGQLHRKSLEPAFPPSFTPPTGSPKADDGDALKPKSQIGRWSHGTAYGFLAAADGNELVRGFKLINPVKLRDGLKKKLSTEQPMLEWEKISEDDARGADEDFDEGVFVGAGGSRLPHESVMSVQAGPDNGGAGASRGNSGWTKLKSR